MFKNFEEINQIELLISDIKKALYAELYLTALISALTIPDVLCRIEYGAGGGDNYSKWVDTYVEDMFGRKYGAKIPNCEVVNYKNGQPLDKTDNERYLESPVSVCGVNCYQLRCSLLHEGNNDIKGNEKSGKTRKFVWIDECVLQFTKDEFSTSNVCGYDSYLKELDNGEIVSMAEKYCYINVRELCNDIIKAAKRYINRKVIDRDKLPKIKINNGGGKMPSSIDPEGFANNMRLWNKYMKKYKMQ